MGISPAGSFGLTTNGAYSTSTAGAQAYMAQIDQNSIVAERLGANFSPSEITPSSARNMTMKLGAGWLFNGLTLTEVAGQTSPAITAPVNASRIDRVVIDAVTGAVSVVAGSEAATPSPPSIPSGKLPVARLTLVPGMTAIGNSMLTDERAGIWGQGVNTPVQYLEFTSTGTFSWNRPIWMSSNALLMGLVWGGGGAASNNQNDGAGGGAACTPFTCKAGDLSTSVTVVVAPGGAISTTTGGANGGVSQFGPFFGYPGAGASGAFGGGAGGGVMGSPGGGIVGAPVSTVSDGNFGGGTGESSPPGKSVYGGGGGAFQTPDISDFFGSSGGQSIWGGGGGASEDHGSILLGGVSLFGGNGGNAGQPGNAPGGGGGASTGNGSTTPIGARGEVRIWAFRG